MSANNTGKLWLVSNGMLTQNDYTNDKIIHKSGGLASALSMLSCDREKIWCAINKNKNKNKNIFPINIKPELYANYYDGFCNQVLWPILHSQLEYINYSEDFWKAYKKVNKIFAKKISNNLSAKIYKNQDDQDIIWVQDFHLFLLAKYLKKDHPNLKVGLFLHTPFPEINFFKKLPNHKEILESLKYYDLIGLQTEGVLSNFNDIIRYFNLNINASVYPISIDYKFFSSKDHKVFKFLGVDRVDYIKGLEIKLLAFEKLLDANPDLHKKVILRQIAIPTRENTKTFQDYAKMLDKMVSRINKKFKQDDWEPIIWQNHVISQSLLKSYYKNSDAILITSVQDGMNLVALECIAAMDKSDPGVLILSLKTGVSNYLKDALLFDPNDINDLINAMDRAIYMNLESRVKIYKKLIKYIKNYNTQDWANNFLYDLNKNKNKNKNYKYILPKIINKKILLIFDFDGTLAPHSDIPNDVNLCDKTRSKLKLLSSRFPIIIVSGRDKEFLLNRFKDLPVSLGAEHGGLYLDKINANIKDNKWQNFVNDNHDLWYEKIYEILKSSQARLPLSFIERKDHCLTWHFRKSKNKENIDFINNLLLKIKNNIENNYLLSNPIEIIEYEFCLEIRHKNANKGKIVSYLLDNKFKDHHVICVGDDLNDEDMFKVATQRNHFAIKIGSGETNANYKMAEQGDVLPFLDLLESAFVPELTT